VAIDSIGCEAAMSPVVEASESLLEPGRLEPKPVCVLSGDEWFLKAQVLARLRRAALGEVDQEFATTRFDGPDVAFDEVLAELSTLPMFGGGRRLVVIDEADDFVQTYRPELEQYVTRPEEYGLLVLEVKSFPATIRLYRAVATSGLVIRCVALSRGQLRRWLRAWAAQEHNIDLGAPAADLLVEMVGQELGLLDQELRKLALDAGPQGRIGVEQIERAVGTWRAKTAWAVLDAALAGDVPKAFVELDRLLLAGENPTGVLAQMAASLRRLAAAARIVLDGHSQGRRVELASALAQAGVPQYWLAKAQAQLRKLGRERAVKLYRWLLEADMAMKGASSLPPRLILERLLLRLAGPRPRRSPPT